MKRLSNSLGSTRNGARSRPSRRELVPFIAVLAVGVGVLAFGTDASAGFPQNVTAYQQMGFCKADLRHGNSYRTGYASVTLAGNVAHPDEPTGCGRAYVRTSYWSNNRINVTTSKTVRPAAFGSAKNPNGKAEFKSFFYVSDRRSSGSCDYSLDVYFNGKIVNDRVYVRGALPCPKRWRRS